MILEAEIEFDIVILETHFFLHLDDIFFQWAKAGARAAKPTVRRPWPIEKNVIQMR